MNTVDSTGAPSTIDASQNLHINNLVSFLSHFQNHLDTDSVAEHRRQRWAVIGPQLLQSAGILRQVEMAHIETTTASISPIEIPCATSNNERLGHAFERFITAQFNASSSVDVLAHRRQVFDDDRVVGEIDLLFEDADSIWHWELANKMYLGVPGLHSDANGWVGPNLNDRFDWKLAKLREQLDIPIPAELCAHTDKPLKRAIFGRGCLYYPYTKHDNVASVLPPETHPSAWQGVWCTQSQTVDLLSNGDWLPVARRDWMTPLVLRDDDCSQAHSDSVTSTNNRAISIFARMQPRDNIRVENLRLAVVDDDWPDRALRFAHGG